MAGIFDTGIFDNAVFDTQSASASLNVNQSSDNITADGVGVSAVAGTLSSTQADNTAAASGEVGVRGSLSLEQAASVASSSASVSISGALIATVVGDSVSGAAKVNVRSATDAPQQDHVSSSSAAIKIAGQAAIVQASNNVIPPIVVSAPSYGHWVKTKNRNKPKAPQLPPPVEASEVVIDEAVLRQMEEERLAALVLQKKTEALERVEDLRSYAPADKRPTRSITIDPRRFDIVETAPEIRTRVINLFRPPPPAPLKEPVRGSITLRALGPRHLPQPEIRKARTISLRRSSDRMMQTGT